MAEKLIRNAYYKWIIKDLPIATNVPEVEIETEVVTSEMGELISDFDHVTIDTNISDNKIIRSLDVDTFTPSDSYNGAKFENYSWSQTINEIDVFIKVPENVTSKDLSVMILSHKISVKRKGTDIPLMEGDLCQKCKHTSAIWSLDERKLEIHVEKLCEMWWNCLLQSEPKLDVTKLDCSRPYEELSEEAQAKIQELTWNQERKRMGLPTSDELKMHQKFQHAWDIEGSPFKEPSET